MTKNERCVKANYATHSLSEHSMHLKKDGNSLLRPTKICDLLRDVLGLKEAKVTMRNDF